MDKLLDKIVYAIVIALLDWISKRIEQKKVTIENVSDDKNNLPVDAVNAINAVRDILRKQKDNNG